MVQGEDLTLAEPFFLNQNKTMATLNIDNLPDELITQIEKLATKNNCSIKEQAIALLKNALIDQTTEAENLPSKSITEIIEESRNRR